MSFNNIRFFLNLSIFLFAFLFWSCEEDIEVSNSFYFDGGPGTSNSTGAIEFRFDISRFVGGQDYIEVRLYPSGQVRRITVSGQQTVSFSNLTPGFFDYDILDWNPDSGFGNSGGVSFGTGGFSTSYTSYYGGPSYDLDSIGGTAEVFANETLVIEISI